MAGAAGQVRSAPSTGGTGRGRPQRVRTKAIERGRTMAASQSKVIQRSKTLRAPKFASVIDRYIPAGEKVLNAADCSLFRFIPMALDGSTNPELCDGAVVL